MIAIDDGWCADHPLPPLGAGLDKEARGTVLVVGGSALVPGAPLLTGEAALRVGAGKVQLGIVGSVAAAAAVAFPECAVVALPVGADGEITDTAAERLGRCAGSCDVLVVGPGMNGSPDMPALLAALLDAVGDQVAVVVDAGAMGALGQIGDKLANRAAPCVITPHHGEITRLLDRDRATVSADPARAARAAADEFGVIVALKAATTILAMPGGTTLRHVSRAPGLGTAGSGDVLAGAIAGLLARGCAPLEAVAWGVRLHAEAGRQAGEALGAIGYLARDLLPLLPRLASSGV